MVQSEITREQDLLVVSPRGRLTQEESALLCDEIAPHLEPDIGAVLLNLSAVEYMNSSALGAVILLFQRVRSAGAKMAVAVPDERMNLLLEVAGLNKLLALRRTLQDARSFLKGREPQA